MTLEQFIKKTHEDVDKFQKSYLLEREKPENGKRHWPLKMNEVDWLEQFIMYLQNEEG